MESKKIVFTEVISSLGRQLSYKAYDINLEEFLKVVLDLSGENGWNNPVPFRGTELY